MTRRVGFTSDTICSSVSRRVHARCFQLNDGHLHVVQTRTWLFPLHPSQSQGTWMAGRSYFESKAYKNHSRLLLLSHAVGACWPKRVLFIFYLFILELWKRTPVEQTNITKAVQLSWEAAGRPKQRRDPPKSSERICFGFLKINESKKYI